MKHRWIDIEIIPIEGNFPQETPKKVLVTTRSIPDGKEKTKVIQTQLIISFYLSPHDDFNLPHYAKNHQSNTFQVVLAYEE